MPPEEATTDVIDNQVVQEPQAEQVPPTEQETSAPPSRTLADVLAERQAIREGKAQDPQGPPKPQPQIDAPNAAEEKPQGPEPPKAQDQRDQLWELSQTNPELAIELLTALKKTQRQETPQEPETQEEQRFSAQTFQQQAQALAQQHFSERPQITLAGLLGGDDVLHDLQLQNTDFTDTLTKFVQATVLPEILTAMAQFHAPLQEKFDTLQYQLKPVLADADSRSIAKEAFPGIEEVFPQIKGNPTAQEHYTKTFNELAPKLADQQLLDNPHSNPKEYAKLMRTVAMFAAKDFVSEPPAQETKSQPVTPPVKPQAMSPAPAPIQQVVRNHLGQFQKPSGNASLHDINRARAEALLKRL